MRRVDGRIVRIDAAGYWERPVLMVTYNLEVDEDHTFSVGNAGSIVHNGDVEPIKTWDGGILETDDMRNLRIRREGVIYRPPDPYIGSANDLELRDAWSTDGWNRKEATILDTFLEGDTLDRFSKERKAVLEEGLPNLKNKILPPDAVTAGHEIIPFWDWFSIKENHFRKLVDGDDNQFLVNELNSRIIALGDPAFRPRLNWELGRGASNLYQFAVSPTVRKKIPIAAEIVRLAPYIENWEIRLFKQPKPPLVFCYAVHESNGKQVASPVSKNPSSGEANQQGTLLQQGVDHHNTGFFAISKRSPKVRVGNEAQTPSVAYAARV